MMIFTYTPNKSLSEIRALNRMEKVWVDNRDDPMGDIWTLRVRNVLAREKIITWRHLINYGLKELRKTPDIGDKSIKEIQDVLAFKGYELKR